MCVSWSHVNMVHFIIDRGDGAVGGCFWSEGCDDDGRALSPRRAVMSKLIFGLSFSVRCSCCGREAAAQQVQAAKARVSSRYPRSARRQSLPTRLLPCSHGTKNDDVLDNGRKRSNGCRSRGRERRRWIHREERLSSMLARHIERRNLLVQLWLPGDRAQQQARS